jgi:plastocyanin
MVRGLSGVVVALLAVGTLASAAVAADPVEIPLAIEKHEFSPAEIRVKASAPFVLVITNKDATAEEFESKDLRVEKVIPGNKTVRLRLPGLKAGTYPFVGEFHQATAKGRIIAE